MNKNNPKLVPQLRFPEFKNTGEWESKELGTCLVRHPEYGINAAAVPFSDNLPTYLRITDISEDGYFLKDNKVSVGKDIIENNYLEEGDIVLARTGASVGKSYKYRIEDGKLVFAGFLIRIRPDKYKLNVEFIFQYFSTEEYWRWVILTSARSGQPGINGNEYSSMPIFLPSSIKEQQKIADCLSSLDELIAANIEKLDALKSHKKGLMQRLFPAEGEAIPQLRFPEFKNDGEWEDRELNEFIIERVQFQTGEFPLYSLTIEDGVTPKTERYERKFLVNDAENAYKLVCPNDFAYNPMNLRFGAIARHKGIENVLLSKYYNVFYCNSSVNSAFCEVYFRSQGMINLYDNVATGTLIEKRRVHFSNFLKMKIKFPKIKEQQKIADCLSSLDELIEAISNKIEALKQHKKGLMQGLFPKNIE